MSYKRSHGKAFEAELQKQESPFVFYGTPLPPLDDNVRDDGSFVPVWQQEVRDERGRKRLHGAFTGGWSAGYFNTVGSKEGWMPSAFKSSRSDRAKDRKDGQPRPENYMDDEDLAEAEESKLLQTAGSFTGLGGTEHDMNRQAGLLDVFRPTEATMGVKLLQKMGWKHGQGLGPRVRRAVRDEGGNGTPESAETHLFAPENSTMISFNKKADHKGLGYGGEAKLSRPPLGNQSRGASEDEAEDTAFSIRSKPKSAAKSKVRGGFGMGVLNDTGSDDDDPYTMGPKISYNRVIGGDKKKGQKASSKASKPATASSNPLLTSKPLFTPKSKSTASGFHKGHDGRLPLDGFVLSIRPASPQETYKPPKIPEGWVSKFDTPATKTSSSTYQSTSDAAKASCLDPKDRANLLGEQSLPGKSVFDFMSSATRDRLATASGRSNLPAAGNEAAPEGFRKSDADKTKDLRSRLPELDQEIAMQALRHTSMPYAEDEGKRRRYRQFLEMSAGTRGEISERLIVDGRPVSDDDFIKELHEFAHAARVFRPMSGLMASRFTSSSSSVLQPDSSDPSTLLSTPAAKPTDPAEEAAKLGMYGPMTRMVSDFYPTRLVCKRFNVKPPVHVTVDPGDEDGAQTGGAASAPVSRKDIDRMMQDASFGRGGFVSGGVQGGVEAKMEKQGGEVKVERAESKPMQSLGPASVDVERNEALEKKRPGEELFKAIFGSDDEDE